MNELFLTQEQIEEITDVVKAEMIKVFQNKNNNFPNINKCCKSIYFELMAKYYGEW